jgi:hypothetical protein
VGGSGRGELGDLLAGGFVVEDEFKGLLGEACTNPHEPPRAGPPLLVQCPATRGLVVGVVVGIPGWHARGNGARVQLPSASSSSDEASQRSAWVAPRRDRYPGVTLRIGCQDAAGLWAAT